MVTKIKKGATKAEINAAFEQLASMPGKKKGFDAYKFCGTVKFNKDALEIQKQLRDEWE
jgi:hypothetical protein